MQKNKELWRPNLLPRSDEMNKRYQNPDNDSRGVWKSSDLSVKTYSAANDYPITTPSGRVVKPPKSTCWRVSKDKFNELVKDNRIWFGPNGDSVPSIKRFLSEVKDGVTPQTIWFYSEVGHNQDARKEIKGILTESDFSTPKPEKLMKRIIELGSNEGDIVLDFFAGSGTTAAVALKLKRHFITCEQMDYVESVTKERLTQVVKGDSVGISAEVEWTGGSSFIYMDMCRLNEMYIDKISLAKDSNEVRKLVEEIIDNALIDYRLTYTKEQLVEELKELPIDDQRKILRSLLDKNMLYLNLSEIEDSEYDIPTEVKSSNRAFYSYKHKF